MSDILDKYKHFTMLYAYLQLKFETGIEATGYRKENDPWTPLPQNPHNLHPLFSAYYIIAFDIMKYRHSSSCILVYILGLIYSIS